MSDDNRQSHPEVFLSWDEIARLPEKVREICLQHDVKIKKEKDLASYLNMCENVKTKQTTEIAQDIKLCLAQRALSAIVACGNERKLKQPLTRIASHDLAPSSKTHSPGKDALFELEILQYARHRGLRAKLGEPDVIVQSPIGDYFVACKTINSQENFEKQLSRGCRQLDRLGPGCVAFNFEPQISTENPIRVNTLRGLHFELDRELKILYERHRRHIDKRLEDERLDGAMLQISCYANIRESTTALDVFTHTVYYSHSGLQQADAVKRFNWFRQAMQGQLVSYR